MEVTRYEGLGLAFPHLSGVELTKVTVTPTHRGTWARAEAHTLADRHAGPARLRGGSSSGAPEGTHVKAFQVHVREGEGTHVAAGREEDNEANNALRSQL